MEVAKRQGGLFAEIDLLTSHLPEGMTSIVGGKVDAASTKNKECHFLGIRLCGSDKSTDTDKGKGRINVKSKEVPVITKHDLAALLNRLLKVNLSFPHNHTTYHNCQILKRFHPSPFLISMCAVEFLSSSRQKPSSSYVTGAGSGPNFGRSISWMSQTQSWKLMKPNMMVYFPFSLLLLDFLHIHNLKS